MEDDKRMIQGPDDDRIMVPSERVITRNAGCWNCTFRRDANEFWFGDKTKGTFGRRGENLNKALTIAMESPMGENHPKVVNIRRMVEFVDPQIKMGMMVRCGGGYDKSELIANTFMCERYVGATGASVAREGERINDLAEEIRDKIDGPDPVAKLNALIDEAKKDGGE